MGLPMATYEVEVANPLICCVINLFAIHKFIPVVI